MNRRAAKKAADDFVGTISDLKAMIAAAPRHGESIVNPSLTKERALGIFEAALAERDDAERPAMWRRDPYSRTGAMKRTRDQLIVQNIHRECA